MRYDKVELSWLASNSSEPRADDPFAWLEVLSDIFAIYFSEANHFYFLAESIVESEVSVPTFDFGDSANFYLAF